MLLCRVTHEQKNYEESGGVYFIGGHDIVLVWAVGRGNGMGSLEMEILWI